jgi:type IV pilus assembly protein PilA
MVNLGVMSTMAMAVKHQSPAQQHAFSLLECLITLSIMAMLSTLAIPSYLRYSRRAFYSELMQMAAPYQFAVALCAQQHASLTPCSDGQPSIPNAMVNQHHIASLSVHQGVIHIIPLAQHGLNKTDDLQLKPILDDIGLAWQRSGGAVDKGYVA